MCDCPWCGAEVKDRDNFCTQCGERLIKRQNTEEDRASVKPYHKGDVISYNNWERPEYEASRPRITTRKTPGGLQRMMFIFGLMFVSVMMSAIYTLHENGHSDAPFTPLLFPIGTSIMSMIFIIYAIGLHKITIGSYEYTHNHIVKVHLGISLCTKDLNFSAKIS